MSDSPRTDAEAYGRLGQMMVDPDFARQLERELTDLRAKLEQANERIKMVEAVNMCLGHQVADKDADRIFFRDKAKQAERERDEAFETAAKVCDERVYNHRYDICQELANAIRALKSPEPKEGV